jgi:hypothetical protein
MELEMKDLPSTPFNEDWLGTSILKLHFAYVRGIKDKHQISAG